MATTTSTKRKLPTLEELRSWAALPNEELEDRIADMLSNAEEYDRPADMPVDLRNYRQGLEDGVVSALTEWHTAATDPTPAERASGAGVPVARIMVLTRALGLDAAETCQGVADAVRRPEATR